jgi:hypothetical protein
MGRKLVPGVDKIDEDWVKKEVKLALNAYTKLHYYMPVAGVYGKSGTHDFIICQRGLFWSIETKAGSNKPTDNQIDFAEDIRKAGGISLCINERTIAEVHYVCQWVRDHGTLPAGHNFEAYRK